MASTASAAAIAAECATRVLLIQGVAGLAACGNATFAALDWLGMVFSACASCQLSGLQCWVA